MNNVFCTILSKLRVYQGLVLYRSLDYNTDEFKLYILCADEESYSACSKMNLTKAVLVRAEYLGNEQLLFKRFERELNEFCWTLKPFLIEYVMNQCQPIEYVTYVDSDICFFNNPKRIYREHMGQDVLLSEHDYSLNYRGVEQSCGKYNSGFIVFKNAENARYALKWWQDRCMEWCFDRVEEGKFGDQKYLEFMPGFFRNVGSIITPGVNIGPWNDTKYHFLYQDGKIFANKDKLICYHFSGFRVINKNKIALVGGSRKIHNILHLPYIDVLKNVFHDIEKVAPEFNGFVSHDKLLPMAIYHEI
ncbi:MAG: hypothetical protein FH760_19375 [Geosporobacter ferrireducens]|nr:putative nucleotide-diphospho-sugar transferase [Geosporobacter ferrireducens]MTI57005.1 hypothetical protein [Geosporobacter ferrireducens]